MPIRWTAREREQISRVLQAHPSASGQCVEAADEIVEVAADRRPKIWQLWPAEGDYVLPKVSVGELWYYHFTVEAEAHCVDALTGQDGTRCASYPEEHWKEHDAIDWIADDGRRPPCRPVSAG